MTDVLQKKEWNTKQVAVAVAIAVSITFSATMIWSRFLSGEKNHIILSDRVEKKDSRMGDRVTKLEERVDKLELPNTDK